MMSRRWSSTRLPARIGAALFCAALATTAPGRAAGEDSIRAKGDTLRGHVIDLEADGVTFEPIQGKGGILVKWADVESLESEGSFTVLHGDDGEAHGRILGLAEDGSLLIGEAAGSAERIETSTLFHAFADDGSGLSTIQRLRNRYRYWKGALDAGASYIESSTDKVSATSGLFIQRKKSPTMFLLEGTARYAQEKKKGEPRSVTENVLIGFTRGELDLTERTFTYASTRATHDADQHLSLRLEPRGGAGYRWFKSEKFNLSTDVGVAWIYEDYFGRRGRDNFWALAFGAQADAELPLGTLWRARAEYLPAIDDWDHDYLLRGETSLEFPMLEWLYFKVTLADEYDNTPAEDAVRNKFTSTGGFSAHF